MIDMKTIIQKTDNSIESEIDGEIVLMNLDNNEYYSMDRIGSVIWNSMVEPITIENIISKLLETYNVTQEACEEGTMKFLSVLKDKGIITIQ